MTDPDLEAARRTILAVMKETGMDASQLADAAGISHTTLTRPLNDPNWKYVPSTRTINKIMNVAARMRLMHPLSSAAPPKPPRKKRRPQPRLVKPVPAKKGRL